MTFKLIILFQLLLIHACAQDKKDSVANRIVEERFIKINGIEQWVTIKGDSTKPAILFLHGGPGSPLSPHADAIYGKWEKDFILVQWDQRGAGKTFGRNAPAKLSPEYLRSNPLTIGQMTADGCELAKYLIDHLGKQKILLFGTSWGSALGVRMATKNPELFYAYVGHSQIVNPSADLISDYERLYEMAKTAEDRESLSVLNSIGKPRYDTARNAGKLIRIIKKYERKNVIPAPGWWFELSPEYNNEKDSENRADGDDYSFVNYVGDKPLGIKPINSTINFLKDDYVFKLPVYLIQGEEDILTPLLITKEYFNKIKAPEKKFISISKAAHGLNQSVIDVQYKIMKAIYKN